MFFWRNHTLKVYFYTFGCKVNISETESFKYIFARKGAKVTDTPDEANMIVINSCCVTEHAYNKCLHFIKKQKKESPEKKIVLTGCLAEHIKNTPYLSDADLIVTNGSKGELFDLIRKKQDGVKTVFNHSVVESEGIPINSNKTRAFLKIQDGCDNNCTYCIIPHVRGNSRSKKPEDILSEFNALIRNGFKEIVLVGIHLGSYGKGYNLSLGELLEILLNTKGDYRIRLSSIEFSEIDSRLIRIIKNDNKICPHLHIPLQSGSDVVLKKMNRRYSVKEYLNIIDEIRKHIHHISIGSDVIAGFPGEKEECFDETVNFIKTYRPDFLHVFKYSDRKGTRANGMSDKNNDSVKTIRAKKLRDLGLDLTFKSSKNLISTNQRILVENNGKGFTDNYHRVKLSEGAPCNTFVNTKILGINKNGLLIADTEPS